MGIHLLAETIGKAYLYQVGIPLVAFLLLLVVVAMVEKRYARPYLRQSMESAFLSDYVRRMSDDAQAAGFIFGDYLAHAKPSIKICGTVWFALDRRTLLATTSGTVSGLKSRQTFLFTPLNDGTYLCTTDNIGESDPSGLFRFKRYWNGLFPNLWALHQKRLAKAGPAAMKFREPNAFDAVTEIWDRRCQLMVEKGLARYIDAEKQCWRHSFLGAIGICRCFFVQLAVAFPQYWRRYKPGAGSAT
jgi:hypothetical protein